MGNAEYMGSVAETLLKDEFEESSKRGQTSCVVRLLLFVVSLNLVKRKKSNQKIKVFLL